MRAFRHGDSLAIVMPPAIRAGSQVGEGDDFEFVELEPGVVLLVSRAKLDSLASEKALGLLLKRAMSQPAHPPAAFAAKGEKAGKLEPKFISASEYAKNSGSAAPSAESVLGGRGYALLGEGEARAASKALEADTNAGLVFGVRGFDNKFYVITRAEFDPLSEKILSRLQRGVEMTPEQAAGPLSEDPLKVACALHVLTEKGDALEKKKGVFVLLD